MNETKAPRNSSLKNCACRGFYAVETIDGEQRSYDTGCARQTHNLFAQGHDATLVSFLVKAELSSDVIWRYNPTDPNGKETKMAGASESAALISQALADKTERALVNALDRLAARREPKTKTESKPPRKVAVKVQAEPTSDATSQLVGMGEWVDAKIGRWTYHGTAMENGEFAYETKSGEKKVAAPGTWTKIS